MAAAEERRPDREEEEEEGGPLPLPRRESCFATSVIREGKVGGGGNSATGARPPKSVHSSLAVIGIWVAIALAVGR